MAILDQVETFSVDLVAKVAPWAAPIPTAFLVGRATVNHLAWPVAMGVVAAVIVESLGLATTATALELYTFNQTRRKTDSPAPFALAALLVIVYFLVATGLTVALDIVPHLALYASAIFPTLSLAGITILAIRADHKRRLRTIRDERAERKANRQAVRKERCRAGILEPSGEASNNVRNRFDLDKIQAGRRAKLDSRLDALLDVYRDGPLTGPTEAGNLIGVSRQTVYAYLERLEQAGRIRRNGNGVEVL